MSEDLKKILDFLEIQQVKSLYCETVDLLGQTELVTARLNEILTEDAVAQFGTFGPYEGRQAVIDYVVNDMGAALAWAWHAVHTPRIEIAGDTADCHWTLDLRVKLKAAPETAHLSPGRYIDKFRRTPQGWQISSILWVNES